MVKKEQEAYSNQTYLLLPINAMHDSHSQQDALTWRIYLTPFVIQTSVGLICAVIVFWRLASGGIWTIAEGMVDQIDDDDNYIGYSAEGG